MRNFIPWDLRTMVDSNRAAHNCAIHSEIMLIGSNNEGK